MRPEVVENVETFQTNFLLCPGYQSTVPDGKVVVPSGFDENRWNECSQGIHFFLTFEELRVELSKIRFKEK